MEDLKPIHFDIMGLSETHCATEHHATWTDGAFLRGAAILLGARDATANIGGVGFIVHPRLKSFIRSVQFISHRTAVLKLDIPGQRKPLKVIQVYGPHSNYADEDAEQFYAEVSDQLTDGACRTVLIGDFNARIGHSQEDERFIGPHSAEDRNARGERMAAFAESQRLFVMNTWFKKPKKKRWTWHSPRYETLSELDYVLCDDKTCISNVEVLSHFACKSDHKPVRTTLKLNSKLMKKSLALSSRNHGRTFDAIKLKQAVRQADWTLSGRLNEQYEKLTTTLAACLEEAETRKERCKSRLTEETRKLMEELRALKGTPENADRLHNLAREVRQRVQTDRETYRNRRLVETAEARRSLKKCARDLAQTRLLMPALKDEYGIRKTDRREIEDVCRRFYTQLFDSKVAVPRQPRPVPDDAEPLPAVTIEEIETAVRSMKNGKAPGPDGITAEQLRAGGRPLFKVLAKLFSHCLKTQSIPLEWKESKTVLLFKKGDREDIGNYRPICLLSVVYKVFTKVVLNRLTETLDEAQPPEQAGFRSGYCTLDHLQALNQLMEKAREYDQHLFVVFIDYEKAFDSVEMNAVWNSLEEQGVDPRYVQLLEEANSGCSTDITLFDEPLRIPVKRGVKQGDTISPKLFTAALEAIFRSMYWESDKRAGVSIDGKRLTHLRFADDVVLVGRYLADVQRRLTQLDARSEAVGLRINRKKTKWFEYHQSNQQLKIGDEVIERVSKYVYLGQELAVDHKLDSEITRRQKAAWQSYSNVKEALQNVTDAKLRANLFNTTVLPALLYGCETWAATKSQLKRLAVTQRSIERRSLGISMWDHQRNEEVREQSQFADAASEALKRKLRWAGHVARMPEEKWTLRTTTWKPTKKRPPNWGIPRRWADDITEVHGPNWIATAQDRQHYREQCALHLERLDNPD